MAYFFTLLIISIACLFPYNAYSFSGERIVTNAVDGFREGNFRVILQDACDDAGPDTIIFDDGLFREEQVFIQVVEPLVIPRDCQGPITILGSKRVEIILDGSRIEDRDPRQHRGRNPGDACMIHVYSDGHTIQELTFVGNQLGAAVCVFGKKNNVSRNRIHSIAARNMSPNRYGIIVSDVFSERFPEMDGTDNIISENHISITDSYGIFVHANNNQINNNTIENAVEAGLFAQGDDNLIEGNSILANQGMGLDLRGNENLIDDNQIFSNLGTGLQLQGNDNLLTQNQIIANGGCPDDEPSLPSQTIDCLPDGLGGWGLVIEAQSQNNRIGGGSFVSEGNTIQYNRDGGIVMLGDGNTQANFISHNLISKNYGSRLGIDLGGDGITHNDYADLDEGPNHLLNYVEYFQMFPLVPSPEGEERFYTFGLALTGSRVEFYKVSPEDLNRGVTHGGGDEYLGSVGVGHHGLEILPDSDLKFKNGDMITTLLSDGQNNTSEFSWNFKIGPDQDMDGILDEYETGNGLPDSGASSAELIDSDGDGLPDAIEDRNRNGVYEPNLGETCAYRSDTDFDGLSDWYEIHGDGNYAAGVDTNPWIADTDGDGVLDGEEDANQNGVWDGYLGEGSPLLRDSDEDYHPDSVDNCPAIYNPGQEYWYCRREET